jgi:hypothetical protein
VIEHVEGGGGDARAKLRRLFALAAEVHGLMGIELAIRDWARRATPRSPRACAASTTGAWSTCARCSARSAPTRTRSKRCLIAFSLWIGSHFVAADHGPRSREDLMTLALRRLED